LLDRLTSQPDFIDTSHGTTLLMLLPVFVGLLMGVGGGGGGGL